VLAANKPAPTKRPAFEQRPAPPASNNEASGATTTPVTAPAAPPSAQVTAGPANPLAQVAPNWSPVVVEPDAASAPSVPVAVLQPAAPDSTPKPPVGAGEPSPPVRVIASSSMPLGDALGARPSVDEHTSGGPAQIAAAKPLPALGPPAEEPAVQVPSVANREGTLDPRDVLLPAAPIEGVRTAQAKDLQAVWSSDAIPMEHIAAKPKMLTPMVGNVRVRLKSKDIFEGKLYAIGENAVWLEGAFGRMSLDHARIDSVEKLAPEGNAAKSGANGAERARVKTPGGLVFGKVISKESTKVTLLTDAGLTLTVDAKDVEYLAPAPSLIIKSDAPVK
jgi:hypothetical protein